MKKFISYLLVAAFVSCSSGVAIVPKSADAAVSPTVDSARDAEYQIIADYLLSAPKIPTKKAKGTAADIESIKNAITGDIGATTYSVASPFLSSKSLEMLSRIPLLVNDIETRDTHTYTLVKMDKPVFYKDLKYAKVKVQIKNERNKKIKEQYIMIKENGVWKVDYIQMFKVLINK